LSAVDRIVEFFNPVKLYFLTSGPFGENTYVVIIPQQENVAERIRVLSEEINEDISIVVLTQEEFSDFENTLERMGEKII